MQQILEGNLVFVIISMILIGSESMDATSTIYKNIKIMRKEWEEE